MPDLSDKEIESRKSLAGWFGFVLGCIAAILAFGIELFIAPKPLTGVSILTAALMAAMNVPFGIVLGLIGERMTRKRRDERS